MNTTSDNDIIAKPIKAMVAIPGRAGTALAEKLSRQGIYAAARDIIPGLGSADLGKFDVIIIRASDDIGTLSNAAATGKGIAIAIDTTMGEALISGIHALARKLGFTAADINGARTVAKAVTRAYANMKKIEGYAIDDDSGNTDNKKRLRARRENRIAKAAHAIGIKTYSKGYRYIKTGALIAAENPDALDSITKELYPEIARIHNARQERVEKCIRYAIESVWSEAAAKRFETLMGHEIHIAGRKPRNSALIAMIAEYANRPEI